MLMHPSLLLFYLSLMISIFLVISANSWFVVWVGLEMNLIFFIPLMLMKNNKYSNEAGIKYFLVQAFASILIISSVLFLSEGFMLMEYILLSGLFLKMGSAPFHQWLPSLVEGLSWGCLTVLFVLQKISPLLLVSFLFKDNLSYNLIYMVIVVSSLIGSIGGLMSVSLRKIMAYSSISHMSWILIMMLLSNFGWMSYYLIYCLVLMCVLDVFNKSTIYSINQLMLTSIKVRIFSGISLLSLGGLPPFTGFLPKFMVTIMLLQNELYFIFFALLGGTFLSLFFYMRLVLVSVVLSSKNLLLMKMSMKKEGMLELNVVGLNILGLFFLVL
uniref:NADH-ubiquinone oxidoreductase chain 2 n=1 Tax=Hyalella sp. 2015-x TaxID=2742071 RepID=A0A7T8ZSC0_9CRUS|nr:NADH dehydrogenase subunit 2 [Hyalella sp. 2015-x]